MAAVTGPLPDLAQIIVEVGFSAPTTGLYLHLDDTARGRLDTATLAPDDLFTAVTPWVVSWSTHQGARRADGPIMQYDGGTATIVLRNEDRRFDPSNLAGPYVTGGATQIEPMRAVRLRAEWVDPDSGAHITYPIWRGFADDWKVTYTGPNSSIVTLTCKDGFAVLAAAERDPSVAVGAGEDTGTRINRILDTAGWPDEDRVIDVGDSTLQATTLQGNALSEAQLATDSELGELYVDTQGRIAFRRRLGIYEDIRSNTSQARFGDDRTALPQELPYADVEISSDAASLYNLVSITRVGGTPQVAEDAASRTAYLTRSHRRTDLLLESDDECLLYAQSIVWRASQPEQRFSSLTINPRSDTRLWDEVLGRSVGDRITIVRRPPGGGAPMERDVHVRGIDHVGGEDLSWKTTFVLQSASRGQYLILDSLTLGRLDQSALAF